MRLKALVVAVDPLYVSDHLSWSRTGRFNAHDLLPLPYTDEALDVVCANIARAQDALGCALLFEHPSSYLAFADGSMTEWDFLARMCERTGCGLLLDVNNVYVSAANHGFDPFAYLDGMPAERVRQIHLAGHSQGESLLIDTHDRDVPDGVWALYAHAVARCGPVATMIERDADIPPLPDLLAELAIARRLGARPALQEAARRARGRWTPTAPASKRRCAPSIPTIRSCMNWRGSNGRWPPRSSPAMRRPSTRPASRKSTGTARASASRRRCRSRG